MTSTNKLIIPINDNPELREYFSTRQPGDVCVLTVTATVDDQVGKSVTLSVKDVEVQDYDEGEETPDETMAGETSEPVLDSYYEPTTVPPEPVKKSSRPNNRSAANVAYAYGTGSSEQPSI